MIELDSSENGELPPAALSRLRAASSRTGGHENAPDRLSLRARRVLLRRCAGLVCGNGSGDLSLQPTFDPCITGLPQPAIVDGFFMSFKPLSPGGHVIRVFGADVRGANKTYTYDLRIE